MKTFENYLQDKFMENEPMVLDDDLPDAFEAWLSDLQADDFMQYGEEYGELRDMLASKK